jgi:uncharacterized protein YbjT (DUF2867 family)
VKILVAGGTGFLGRHVARALLDAGHEVVVLSRDPSKVQGIPALQGAAAVAGDVTDPSSLPAATHGCVAVVCLVQFPNYPFEVPRKGLTFDRYDRGGAENLLAAAKEAGVGRFVYGSGVRADPGGERTWLRAKGRAEEAVRDSGLDFTIVRPSWGYGPGDRALNRFVQIARFSPVVPRIGWHTQRIQPVYVGDVAEAYRRVFEVDEAVGRTFEIGGPDVMTMDEIIRTMLDVAGKRRLVIPVPTPLVRLGAVPLSLFPRPVLTPRGVDFATQDGLADNSALEEILGVHPMPLREGLARYLGSARDE